MTPFSKIWTPLSSSEQESCPRLMVNRSSSCKVRKTSGRQILNPRLPMDSSSLVHCGLQLSHLDAALRPHAAGGIPWLDCPPYRQPQSVTLLQPALPHFLFVTFLHPCHHPAEQQNSFLRLLLLRAFTPPLLCVHLFHPLLPLLCVFLEGGLSQRWLLPACGSTTPMGP